MSKYGACLVLLLALAPTPPARAWCRMTTSMLRPAPGECITEGTKLFWRHRCTTAYRFQQDGTPDLSWADLRAVAQASFGAWGDITCPGGEMPHMDAHEGAELSLCDRSEYNIGSPNVSTIVFVRTGWDARMNDPNAYAVTTVWHSVSLSPGEIYDVDMELNNERFHFTRCGDAPCPEMDDAHIDLQDVMTHEAGHWFGMAHSAEPTATMYFQAPPGEIAKRTLEADDIAGFCDAYATMDPSSTCDDTPRGGLKLTCGMSCGPDPAALPLSPAATGALGSGAPVICSGGATCDVAFAGRRDGTLALVGLACALAILRVRRRRRG